MRLKLRVFRFFVFAALGVLLWACGGSGGGGASGRSAFHISATFLPYSGRDIQGYVGSLKITAQAGTNTPLGPFVLMRSSAPLTISGLSSGQMYRLTIEGFQGTNGTGSLVSSATIERMATSGTTAVNIDTTTSLIASVSVTPGDVTLKAGESQQYTFEAKSASGGTILTSGQDSSFSATLNPSIGSFDSATNIYTAPAIIGQDEPPARLDVSIGGLVGSARIGFDQEASPARVSLRWNADSRGLPGYARSAKLQLLQGGLLVPGTEKAVVRTQKGAYASDVTWSDVRDGTYTLRVSAFASTSGTGPPLAFGDFPITVSSDEIPTVVDMGADDFQAQRVRVLVNSIGGPLVDVTGGVLELVQGQEVALTSYLEAADGAMLLRGGLKTTVTGTTSLFGDRIKGLSVGNGTLQIDAGDSPGLVSIPTQVFQRSVQYEIHWADLDPSAKSARIDVSGRTASTGTLVQKDKLLDVQTRSFDQPFALGPRELRIRTYPTKDGTGDAHRNIILGYQGPLPPAITIAHED